MHPAVHREASYKDSDALRTHCNRRPPPCHPHLPPSCCVIVCVIVSGVPPRRIWLELIKLCKAEALAPGSWPHALKLSYHLGLLPHLFPWLQQQQQQQQQNNTTTTTSSSSADTLDPFGHGVTRHPGPAAVSSSSSSSSSSGVGGGSSNSAAKAVLVAERLSKLWQQQQQQQQHAGVGTAAAAGGLPLPLLVAATVHPSAEGFVRAEPFVSDHAWITHPYHTAHTSMTSVASRATYHIMS